ncbi:prolyl 4-hydroxylase subunit alpha-2 isoform X2 [Drosophila hydei]|uniref:Prolyl 4-hydroxylase subunit alpha-2 isoform X2 n=1 Tax=Drosophila hydei TaxID=7224 RepID=A0A6J1LU69_DROHY|nr:prolyl 4-hydroxylase subunit alpha-2 isoform X2 [Drosophila hydei]
MLPFCLLLLQLLPLAAGKKNVATSAHDMIRVLEGEDDLLKDLRLYVWALERKVTTTRVILDDAIARQQQSLSDPATYVANPLISLPLVRRMHMDAGKILKYLRQEAGADLQRISDYRLDVITEADLEQAAQGLLRTQQFHGLSERDLAQGLPGAKQYNARLKTPDCVALAQHLFMKGEDEQAKQWLRLALDLYGGVPERVNQLLQIDRKSILREIVETHASRENWQGVRAVLEQMLELGQDKQHVSVLLKTVNHHLRHWQICRGHSQSLVSDSLRCRYNTQSAPFLRLAPLKLEQLSIDPHVVLCHNAIHATELEHIIQLSRPHLKRALVGRGIVNEKRFTMDAAVDLNATPQGRTLRQRLEDMSGFDLSNSDKLALINYGIGGQYSMHMDCWHSKDNLTDVQLGGITSFPALGLGVQPSKGSALIWHNMDNEAECDQRTLHAACPILLGNRWARYSFPSHVRLLQFPVYNENCPPTLERHSLLVLLLHCGKFLFAKFFSSGKSKYAEGTSNDEMAMENQFQF